MSPTRASRGARVGLGWTMLLGSTTAACGPAFDDEVIADTAEATGTHDDDDDDDGPPQDDSSDDDPSPDSSSDASDSGGGGSDDATPAESSGSTDETGDSDHATTSTGDAESDDGASETTGPAPIGEPPVLLTITPTEGPFGTEVVITGENLFGVVDGYMPPSNPRISSANPDAPYCCVDVDDDGIIEWSETELRMRWRYPLDGAIAIETAWGEASIDGFTPDWRGIGPYDGLAASIRIASIALSDGRIAMVLDEQGLSTLVVFDDDGATSYALGDDVSHAALFEDPQGDPAGYVLKEEDGERALYELSWPGALSITGFTTPFDDAVLAAGSDGDGTYAWIRVEDPGGYAYARVRSSDDGWAIDRGPIAGPQLAESSAHFALAHPDGTFTLVHAYILFGISTGTHVAQLAPDASEFGVEESLGGLGDRHRARLTSDGRLIVTGCPSTEDWWNGATGCTFDVQQPGGEWAEPELPVDADPEKWHTFAPTPDGDIAAFYCTDDDTLRVELGGGLTDVARWPCKSGQNSMLGDPFFTVDGTPALLSEWHLGLWHVLSPRAP